MASKKRKLSGLSRIELEHTHQSLARLQEDLVHGGSKEGTDGSEPAQGNPGQRISVILAELQSKLDDPQVV